MSTFNPGDAVKSPMGAVRKLKTGRPELAVADEVTELLPESLAKADATKIDAEQLASETAMMIGVRRVNLINARLIR